MNKEIVYLIDTIDLMSFTDIHRTLYPTTSDYTFFPPQAHIESFSRLDHILGQKTNFSNFKKIEIIPSIFSDHNGMKPKLNHRTEMRNKRLHVD